MVIRAPGPRGTQAGSYAELDDRMLVLDFQAGQIEAFVEIHHRYGALARHVCGRFLPNQQDVDEALQETWIRVFQGLHRFNGRFALQSWISRIATNVSLDILRARSRRPQLDDQPIDEHEREDAADGPEEEVEKLIQRDLVIAVLAGLPDAHRRALVLRELEGRSHREIASELDISPAQAKALIHRAKGTFRREWLRAATERHGLAGFLLLPVIWLSKLGGVARRVADRAGEVAHAGGAEVVTQTAQAVASPVVPMAASGVGEKIIAAGLTLVVAGGVTVGAATVVRHRADRDKPEAVVAAPVPVPSDDAAPAEPVAAEEAAEKEAKGERHDATTQGRGDPEVIVPPVEGEPLASPSGAPSASPSSEPSVIPGPDASPSPSGATGPVIAPVPAWQFRFVALTSSDEACGCDVEPSLESSRVSGDLEGDIAFAQTVKGVVYDRAGDPTWPFYWDQSGTAGPSGGATVVKFVLSSDAGPFWYDGEAALVHRQANDDGSYVYRFSGSYRIRADQEVSAADQEASAPDQRVSAPVPQYGSMMVTLAIWQDGTIYLGSVALVESS